MHKFHKESTRRFAITSAGLFGIAPPDVPRSHTKYSPPPPPSCAPFPTRYCSSAASRLGSHRQARHAFFDPNQPILVLGPTVTRRGRRPASSSVRSHAAVELIKVGNITTIGNIQLIRPTPLTLRAKLLCPQREAVRGLCDRATVRPTKPPCHFAVQHRAISISRFGGGDPGPPCATRPHRAEEGLLSARKVPPTLLVLCEFPPAFQKPRTPLQNSLSIYARLADPRHDGSGHSHPFRRQRACW